MAATRGEHMSNLAREMEMDSIPNYSASIKQKLYGIILAGVGIITAILTRDITLSVLLIPAGVGLVLARETYI